MVAWAVSYSFLWRRKNLPERYTMPVFYYHTLLRSSQGQFKEKGSRFLAFGGVKLGVGGLISAYKTSAEEALNNALIIQKEVTGTIQLLYDYAATPEVMRLVKEFDLDIQSRNFEADCKIIADYKLNDKEKLLARMVLLQAIGVKIYYNLIV